MMRRLGARGGRKPHVVILGGGFAGLAAALELGDAVRVTLIDRRSSFEFLPNIHELVSGVKSPRLLRLPLARILRGRGQRFVRDAVTSIDPVGRRVAFARRRALAFDALIVAAGGENATHGVPGVAEHALAFKSVDDCARIGRRLAALAARAGPGREADVVIVGGGLEGVEALGEVLRRWREQRCFRLHLVEAGPRLLAAAPISLDRRVRKAAQAWGVRFSTGEPVASVEPGGVVLASGRRLPSRATIWTGGPTGSRLLADAALAPKPGAWAPVRDTLQSVDYDEIFVAGDAAELGAPLSKQGYHALDMGRCAAKNAAALLGGRPLERYRPAEKPMLVSFGDLDCFLIAGPLVLASPALATAKEAVFELVMAQLDGREWSVSLPDAGARLAAAGRRIAWPVLSSPASLLRHARWAVLLP